MSIFIIHAKIHNCNFLNELIRGVSDVIFPIFADADTDADFAF